jgi:hypothetical protein
LASYYPENVAQWLECISKAKKFGHWYSQVQSLLLNSSAKLTESQVCKLREILDFCEAFAVNHSITIEAEPPESQPLKSGREERASRNDVSHATPLHDAYLGLFMQGESYRPLFNDFEVLATIGEGSFGRVFKVKHKDSGVVMAMKAMKKQQLVQN